MQNREELRQKGMTGVEEQHVTKVEKYHFGKGGRINIIFYQNIDP
jgi:hypothetical protein